MLLTLILACDSAVTDSADSDDRPAGCIVGPTIEITAPASSTVFPVDQPIALTMEAASEVDAAEALRLLWNVFLDGASDDENIGTNAVESWTPAEVGRWTIRAQVEDTCTDELAMDPVQHSIRVEVQ
ncbi:MAG: hypothetical protein EXR71_07805 [Myxococcales bacterium]|nr:hypothetical protein [Myxococcales bacterium]